MPRLTTTLAAAGLATVIASTVLTSLAGAADDCLSGPNPEIAGGSRWHYRVDRQNHRKCWYRADENRKSERAVPVPAANLRNLCPRTIPQVPPFAWRFRCCWWRRGSARSRARWSSDDPARYWHG